MVNSLFLTSPCGTPDWTPRPRLRPLYHYNNNKKMLEIFTVPVSRYCVFVHIFISISSHSDTFEGQISSTLLVPGPVLTYSSFSAQLAAIYPVHDIFCPLWICPILSVYTNAGTSQLHS